MRSKITLSLTIISVALLGGQLPTPLQNTSLQGEMRTLKQQGLSYRVIDNTTIEVTSTVSGARKIKTLTEPDEASIRAWASTRSVPILEIDPTQVDTSQWIGWYLPWGRVPLSNGKELPLVLGDLNRNGLAEFYGTYRDSGQFDYQTRLYELDTNLATTFLYIYPSVPGGGPIPGLSRCLADVDRDSLSEVLFSYAGIVSGFEQMSGYNFPLNLNFSHQRYQTPLDPGFTGIYIGSLNGDSLTDFLYKGSEPDSAFGRTKVYVAEYNADSNNFIRVWATDYGYGGVGSMGGFGVGDFDGDRLAEFVASHIAGGIHLVENQRDNVYHETWQDSTQFVNLYYHAAGDIDNDGKPEFFVGATMSNGNWTVAYEADSNDHYSARFIFHLLSGGSLDEPTYFTRDIDRDGSLELVITSGRYLYIFKSDGNDSYYLWYLKREDQIGSVQFYDINRDGLNDLVISKGSAPLYADIYKADKVTSVHIQSETLPTSLSLQQSFPNPFNPETRIRFFLPHTMHVELSIFDVTGKRIRTLHKAETAAGEHELVWNGRNDLDSQVASGVYLFQLKTEQGVLTKKALLIR